MKNCHPMATATTPTWEKKQLEPSPNQKKEDQPYVKTISYQTKLIYKKQHVMSRSLPISTEI